MQRDSFHQMIGGTFILLRIDVVQPTRYEEPHTGNEIKLENLCLLPELALTYNTLS